MNGPNGAFGEQHLLVVDRLEGDMVVVEVDGDGVLDLPRWMLPPDVKEGDVLRASAGSGGAGWRVEIQADPAEAQARRDAAASRLQRLRERDPGGDIEL